MGVNFFDNLLKYLSNYNGKNILMGDVLPKIKNLQNDYKKYYDCNGQEYCLENGDRVYSIQLFDMPEIFIFVDHNNLCKAEIITKTKSMTKASMFLDKNLSDEALDYLGIDLYETDSNIYYNGSLHSNIQTITNNNDINVCEKIIFNNIKDCNDIRNDLLECKNSNDKLTILYYDGNPYYAFYNGVDYSEDTNYQEFSQNCVDFANRKYEEIYKAIGYSFGLNKNKRIKLKK